MIKRNLRMDLKNELVDMCIYFLSIIEVMYTNGNLTKEEYLKSVSNKLIFLEKCGVEY
jgi:hypothetical protein